AGGTLPSDAPGVDGWRWHGPPGSRNSPTACIGRMGGKGSARIVYPAAGSVHALHPVGECGGSVRGGGVIVAAARVKRCEEGQEIVNTVRAAAAAPSSS